MAVLVVTTRTQLASLGRQHALADSVQQQANDLAYASSSYLLYGDQTLRDRWDSLFASFLRDVDRLEPETMEDAALVDSIDLNAGRLRQVLPKWPQPSTRPARASPRPLPLQGLHEPDGRAEPADRP